MSVRIGSIGSPVSSYLGTVGEVVRRSEHGVTGAMARPVERMREGTVDRVRSVRGVVVAGVGDDAKSSSCVGEGYGSSYEAVGGSVGEETGDSPVADRLSVGVRRQMNLRHRGSLVIGRRRDNCSRYPHTFSWPRPDEPDRSGSSSRTGASRIDEDSEMGYYVVVEAAVGEYLEHGSSDEVPGPVSMDSSSRCGVMVRMLLGASSADPSSSPGVGESDSSGADDDDEAIGTNSGREGGSASIVEATRNSHGKVLEWSASRTDEHLSVTRVGAPGKTGSYNPLTFPSPRSRSSPNRSGSNRHSRSRHLSEDRYPCRAIVMSMCSDDVGAIVGVVTYRGNHGTKEPPDRSGTVKMGSGQMMCRKGVSVREGDYSSRTMMRSSGSGECCPDVAPEDETGNERRYECSVACY